MSTDNQPVQSQIIVRRGMSEDAEHIIGFQQNMAMETEGKTLDPDLIGAGVAAVFESDDKGFYLVAEAEGQVVGSLLVTYEWSDWRNATFLWIQSVYVDAAWRRKGVYSAMHGHVNDIATSRDGICGIRLYVEHENRIAQQTYNGLGMHEAHYYMYEVDFVL
ncbi:MAG: GNAT family N-acetyltransferase [SAR202 cluster bacterium]|nr:GNAT family N-acetyltransferase [SAR202 cluster bacterium]MDP7226328.1 GNAT family N-acetyltransferase [SAR202 cluster bacterium]MDP7414983.1 GNAT family N-acetyltransferase [SAR202 cluster bacterium]MDP7532344.1 GNAT family N-acetyltransferase [SAR202 cluster bacterium]HJO83885.1 GNAT family N-acetyltransferase [SAR202 cluster bacterium]